MRYVQTPCEQIYERLPLRRRRPDRVVRSDQRDPDRSAVEAERVRPDDVPVDSAVTALEHLAAAINQEVVADVVPAVAFHVIDLDASYDRR